MKKKIIILILIIVTLTSITGCKMSNKIFNNEKPTTYYYTNGLLNFYKTEAPMSIVIFYSDLYKERTLDKVGYEDIDNFLNSLKATNFISKPENLPETPIYKVYIEFNKIKYVLNVYNEKYASIYPWDGKYDMDYIDMSDIPLSYNLYGICKFHLPNE